MYGTSELLKWRRKPFIFRHFYSYAYSSLQLLSDPSFVPVTTLETEDGFPTDFTEVLNAMQNQESGALLIKDNARRAVSMHNSLIWRPVESSHYFYTDIPGRIKFGVHCVCLIDYSYCLFYQTTRFA